MKINEIFRSIQGEGLYIGMPATFIRLSGCNLSCDWCDTPIRESKEVSTGEILKRVIAFRTRLVVLTGGEPLVQRDGLDGLMDKLGGFKIHIETNGTIFDEAVAEKADFISISPKLSNSGNPISDFSALKRYILLPKQRFQVKLVVGPGDLDEAMRLLEEIGLDRESNLVIQPIFQGHYKKVLKSMLESSAVNLLHPIFLRYPNARIGFQFHKMIWGRRRGI